jgi:hypothetical protein
MLTQTYLGETQSCTAPHTTPWTWASGSAHMHGRRSHPGIHPWGSPQNHPPMDDARTTLPAPRQSPTTTSAKSSDIYKSAHALTISPINGTHLTLVLTAQLLRDHAPHPHMVQPQRCQHAINLAWQHIMGRPVHRIPPEHVVKKIRPSRPGPNGSGAKLAPANRRPTNSPQSSAAISSWNVSGHTDRPPSTLRCMPIIPIPGSPSPHSLVYELRLTPDPAGISLGNIVARQKIFSLSHRPSPGPSQHDIISHSYSTPTNHTLISAWPPVALAPCPPTTQQPVPALSRTRPYTRCLAAKIASARPAHRTWYTPVLPTFLLPFSTLLPTYGCLQDTFISSHFVSP